MNSKYYRFVAPLLKSLQRLSQAYIGLHNFAIPPVIKSVIFIDHSRLTMSSRTL
jgi:hypothetical protein